MSVALQAWLTAGMGALGPPAQTAQKVMVSMGHSNSQRLDIFSEGQALNSLVLLNPRMQNLESRICKDVWRLFQNQCLSTQMCCLRYKQVIKRLAVSLSRFGYLLTVVSIFN